MSKKNTTLQSIRLSAMRHQLKALQSQIEVVKKLDCEHAEGIDLGADPEAVNIMFFAKKLCSRSEAVIKKAAAHDQEGVRTLLQSIREDVDYLVSHAGAFNKHGRIRAGEHLEHTVDIDAEKVTDQPGKDENREPSFVQAGVSCFRAETSQYRTFELQVMALVYLALEIGYFAADEAGVEPVAIAAKVDLK